MKYYLKFQQTVSSTMQRFGVAQSAAECIKCVLEIAKMRIGRIMYQRNILADSENTFRKGFSYETLSKPLLEPSCHPSSVLFLEKLAYAEDKDVEISKCQVCCSCKQNSRCTYDEDPSNAAYFVILLALRGNHFVARHLPSSHRQMTNSS